MLDKIQNDADKVAIYDWFGELMMAELRHEEIEDFHLEKGMELGIRIMQLPQEEVYEYLIEQEYEAFKKMTVEERTSIDWYEKAIAKRSEKARQDFKELGEFPEEQDYSEGIAEEDE